MVELSCMVTATFWTLVGTFVLIVSQFFIPPVRELLRGSLLFLLPMAVFFLLGIALVVLTLKKKLKGKLKKFLILTGASAAGFFISVLLHNLLYGLGVITEHIAIVHYPATVLHIVFFLIAIFVCPIGFLVGVVGSFLFFRQTDSL